MWNDDTLLEGARRIANLMYANLTGKDAPAAYVPQKRFDKLVSRIYDELKRCALMHPESARLILPVGRGKKSDGYYIVASKADIEQMKRQIERAGEA